MAKNFELAGVTDDEVLAVDISRGAKMLGVSDRHFRKEIVAGRIRVVRMGTRVLVPIQSLREYLNPPQKR